MKKFSIFLFALGLLCSTSIWAETTYQLINGSTLNTTDFRTGVTGTTSCNYTVEGVTYTQCMKLGANQANIFGVQYQERFVAYDSKTDETDVEIVCYSTAAKNLCLLLVPEGKSVTQQDTIIVSIPKNAGVKKLIHMTGRSSLYCSTSGCSNVCFCQITATEKGNVLPKAGEIGYSVSYVNGGRLATRAASSAFLDGVEIVGSNSIGLGKGTNAVKIQTAGTHYVKFTTGAKSCLLKLTVSTSTKYYISTTKGGNDGTEYKASSEVKLAANTTYYINPGGSVVTITKMEFAEPPVEYSVTYDITGAASGTAPTQDDVAEGKTFTIAGATGFTAPSGKMFKCWNDGTKDYAAGATYTMGKAGVTLTAQWADVYTINFNIGAATGSLPETIQNVAGFEYNLPSSAGMEYSKHIFAGWKSTATGAVYAAGTKMTISGDDTFTAQWEDMVTPAASSLNIVNAANEVVPLTWTIPGIADITNPVQPLCANQNNGETNIIGYAEGAASANYNAPQYGQQGMAFNIPATTNMEWISAEYKGTSTGGVNVWIGAGEGYAGKNAYWQMEDPMTMPISDNTWQSSGKKVLDDEYWGVGGPRAAKDKIAGLTMKQIVVMANSGSGTKTGTFSVRNIRYHWKDAVDVEKVVLLRKKGSAATGIDDEGADKIFEGSAFALTYTDSETKAGGKYYYTLYCLDADGNPSVGVTKEYELVAKETFNVTYTLGEGVTGDAPTQAAQIEGQTFTVASGAGIKKSGYMFDKWNDGTNDYAAGATYTMPNHAVEFTPVWVAVVVPAATDFQLVDPFNSNVPMTWNIPGVVDMSNYGAPIYDTYAGDDNISLNAGEMTVNYSVVQYGNTGVAFNVNNIKNLETLTFSYTGSTNTSHSLWIGACDNVPFNDNYGVYHDGHAYWEMGGFAPASASLQTVTYSPNETYYDAEWKGDILSETISQIAIYANSSDWGTTSGSFTISNVRYHVQGANDQGVVKVVLLRKKGSAATGIDDAEATKFTLSSDLAFSYTDNEEKENGTYYYTIFCLDADGNPSAAVTKEYVLENKLDPEIAFAETEKNITIGDKYTLVATTVAGYDGTVTYSAAPASVVSINATTGEVEGLTAGTATITATASATDTYASKMATYTVNVALITPSASFATASKNLNINETFTQTVTTNSDGAVTYSSNNTTLAMVDADGKVTAKAEGYVIITANIAATAQYAACQAQYEVHVSSTVVHKRIEITPEDDLRTVIFDENTLSGDTIVLADGEYPVTADCYISTKGLVIMAAEGAHPVINSTGYIEFFKEASLIGLTFNFTSGSEASVWFQGNGEGLNIENCVISSAAGYGLRVYSSPSFVRIVNSTFKNIGPAAVYFQPSNATPVTIDHCTFINTATGSNFAVHGQNFNSSNTTVSNCVIYNTQSGGTYGVCGQSGNNATVTNCLIYGFYAATMNTTNTNLIEQDPKLTDVAGGDYTYGFDSPIVGAATDGGNIGDPRWSFTLAAHTRSVAAGNFGTICLPYAMVEVEGAELYKITSRDAAMTKVAIDMVEASATEAGVAYIFYTTENAQNFYYIERNGVDDPIQGGNMVGTFVDLTTTFDSWMVVNNLLTAAKAGSHLAPYRAYVPSLEDIEVGDVSAAPGRRIFNMRNTPTDLNEMPNAIMNGKFIKNNRFMMIKDGKVRDIMGNVIK